jgi:hypothetical protein
MMAPGEIRFSTTMPCQMPVLAQSQTCTGCGTVYDPNDATKDITVTSSTANGALVAQEWLPPMMGLGDDLDPVAQALNEGRKPTDADYAARARWQQLKPQIGTPPQFPIDPAPTGFWQNFLQWWKNFFSIPSGPPGPPPPSECVPTCNA